MGGWWDSLGRSPDSVGRSLDSVGRTPDSVGHSLWPTGGGRAAAQAGGAGSLPLSRCATAPPRGERLDRVVRGATPGWQALAPGSARSVRRWLPRVGAAAGGGRAAAQAGGAGNLPLSRCATAPPRGERFERVALESEIAIGLFGGRLQAGRLWLLDRRAPFGGGSPRVGAAAGGLWGGPCGSPGWRGWEPPPQSLRDSSPSGERLRSGCSGGDSRLADFGSRIGARGGRPAVRR